MTDRRYPVFVKVLYVGSTNQNKNTIMIQEIVLATTKTQLNQRKDDTMYIQHVNLGSQNKRAMAYKRDTSKIKI